MGLCTCLALWWLMIAYELEWAMDFTGPPQKGQPGLSLLTAAYQLKATCIALILLAVVAFRR